MIFVFNRLADAVSIQDIDNVHIKNLNHLWNIEDFQTKFGFTFDEDIRKINYETDRNLYRIGRGRDIQIQDFEKPEDDPTLSWIKDNLNSIIHIAESELQPDAVWDDATSTWVTPVELVELRAMEERQALRRFKIVEGAAYIAAFLREIFSVGRTLGLWTVNDFDPVLVAKFHEFEQDIDDYRQEAES
jgi:hypothetical protein